MEILRKKSGYATALLQLSCSCYKSCLFNFTGSILDSS